VGLELDFPIGGQIGNEAFARRRQTVI